MQSLLRAAGSFRNRPLLFWLPIWTKLGTGRRGWKSIPIIVWNEVVGLNFRICDLCFNATPDLSSLLLRRSQ